MEEGNGHTSSEDESGSGRGAGVQQDGGLSKGVMAHLRAFMEDPDQD